MDFIASVSDEENLIMVIKLVQVAMWLCILAGPVIALRRGEGAQRYLFIIPLTLAVGGMLLSWIPLVGWLGKWLGLGLGAVASIRIIRGILAPRA